MSGMLRKKEMVTLVTPIPGFIPRQLAIDILHSHGEVITLNPLVLEYKPIKAPRDAASDEYYSTWYEILERIQYIPGIGKMGSGKLAFNACFHDMPWGLQAHIYAPMNTDLRYKYRIDGNQPGIEPPEPLEMGLAALGAPKDGLYLREDVEVKCSIAVMSFVKSQLKAASKLMVQRIIKKAELVDAGALHAMLENGKLKTFNPADRSSTMNNMTTSPVSTPSPALSRTEQNADQSQSVQQQQQQQQQAAAHLSTSPMATPGVPQTPSVPYQVPRPQSMATPYNRPGSAGVQQQQNYQVPGTPAAQGLYPGYPGYPGYPPYQMHPGHVSYMGHPGYMPMHPAMYPQYPHPMQQELQGYPVAVPASAGGAPAPQHAVEMPGDYYHAYPTAPAPASSVNSTPQSNRDSDIGSNGQWSVPTDFTQPSQRNSPALSGSRPESTASDASVGQSNGNPHAQNGYRSPGLDKHFSSELPTHRETLEEHRQEALMKLDPTSDKQQQQQQQQQQQHGYAYNPADYGPRVQGRN